MPAMRVVPALDEIEHNGRGFALILESMEREQLALQRRVETLAHRIVVAIANGSHRRSNALALAALAKGDRRVLAALIGVMDHVLRPAPEDRHIERFEDEFGAQVVGHSPTDDATAEHVEYDSQVEKAGPRWDIGDIGNPELIRTVGAEVSIDKIRSRASVAIAHRRDDTFSSRNANDLAFPH